MRELTDDGKGHTELQLHLTEATLPMLPKSALALGKNFQNTAWIIKIIGLQILLSKKTVEPELRQIKEEALQLKRARGSLASCKSSYILHGK